MQFDRAAGVLLHPTSLPGPYGIGDLGPQAYHWIDFLADAGCGLWQVLPLGPTGYGDSPYQCFSAFAGSPFLISPDILLEEGLLTADDLADKPDFPSDRVDFGPLIAWKLAILDRAFARFGASASPELRTEFTAFQSAEASWLADFALFMAIKEAQGGVSWGRWPEALRQRDPRTLQAVRQTHAQSVQRHAFRQFLFFRQWLALREYAHDRGIKIIGDIPIFVAYDSADAWSHSELFYFDDEGNPTVVAGVPPDYFSVTGQLWGNPLYRWEVHKQSGYAWWLDRMRATLKQVDIVRVDHFRGFAGYWEIPYGMPTAEIGRWVPGPGKHFFEVMKRELGDLPIIAEDLGVITDDVVDMRDSFGLPGMRILQFGFTGPENPFLPHHYIRNCVGYTGTHDNDTALGWYKTAPREERYLCRRYLRTTARTLSWDMIRALWSSVANMVLAPMQDLLSLGPEARMNFPGKEAGNWGWRMPADALSDELCNRLAEFNEIYERKIQS
jgi:4-alpha-glucanotransferase